MPSRGSRPPRTPPLAQRHVVHLPKARGAPAPGGPDTPAAAALPPCRRRRLIPLPPPPPAAVPHPRPGQRS